MNGKRESLLNKLEIIGFLMYFIVLFCERVLSLVFSINRGDEYSLLSGNVFNYVAYAVTAASLIAGVVLAVKPCAKMYRAFVSEEAYSFEQNAKPLAIAVAVILFGGMMHTGFTLAKVQFAAYGFLIAALIVRAVEKCLAGNDKFITIVSVIYLTFFSMTIPVCYISFMAQPLQGLFFAAEFLAVFLLVPTFGYMTYRFLKDGVTSFSPIIPAAMLALCGLVVGLGWTEKINWFVLIFVGLTVLTYLSVGIVAFKRLKRQEQGE